MDGQIQENQQNNIEAQPQPASPRQGGGSAHKKWITIGFIIVLIAGTITGAYFLGVKKLNQPKACTQEAKLCPDGSAVGRTGPNCEFTPCPTVKPSESTDQTSTWKTYTNDKLLFAMRYPSDWDLSTYPDSEINKNLGQIGKIVIQNIGSDLQKKVKAEITIDVLQKDSKLAQSFTKGKSEYLIDGEKGLRSYDSIGKGGPYDSVNFTHDNYFYNIVFNPENNQSEKQFFDQILSTFKFIDQNKTTEPGSIDTSTWKTYSSNIYHYSIKYPKDWSYFETFDYTKFYPPNIGSFENNTIDELKVPIIGIQILSRPFSSSPTANQTQDGIDLITDYKTVKIDKITGNYYQTHQCAPRCTFNVDIPISSGQKTLNLYATTNADMNIFNEMLSNFRFIQ